MHKRFLRWVQDKKDQLEADGITTENINITDVGIPNPSVTVDHFSKICLGRISVWETGEMDVEVLHFEKEESLMYKHYELDDETDFDKILIEYISVLSTGTKV